MSSRAAGNFGRRLLSFEKKNRHDASHTEERRKRRKRNGMPVTLTVPAPSLYAEAWMNVHAADFPAISVDEDARNLSPRKPRPKSRRKRAKLHAIPPPVQWIKKVDTALSNQCLGLPRATSRLLSSIHRAILVSYNEDSTRETHCCCATRDSLSILLYWNQGKHRRETPKCVILLSILL